MGIYGKESGSRQQKEAHSKARGGYFSAGGAVFCKRSPQVTHTLRTPSLVVSKLVQEAAVLFHGERDT